MGFFWFPSPFLKTSKETKKDELLNYISSRLWSLYTNKNYVDQTAMCCHITAQHNCMHHWWYNQTDCVCPCSKDFANNSANAIEITETPFYTSSLLIFQSWQQYFFSFFHECKHIQQKYCRQHACGIKKHYLQDLNRILRSSECLMRTDMLDNNTGNRNPFAFCFKGTSESTVIYLVKITIFVGRLSCHLLFSHSPKMVILPTTS